MLDTASMKIQVEECLGTHRIPGLALAVVHRGEILHTDGFGVTSVAEGGVPVTSETLFRVGSVTKPLTGTVLMRLTEMGKLDLDRPVSHYVPWLQFKVPGAADQITLRMLLSHSSGLSSVANSFGPRDPEGLERTIRTVIPELPFVASPGTIYSYCNPGVALAGYIGSVVYGKTYGEMMQELLFTPLEMNRTTFDPMVAMTYPLALPHELDANGNLRVIRPFADHAGFHPAGFAISTVLDLARFAILHLNEGRYLDRRLLAPASVQAMHAAQTSAYTVDQRSAALSFFCQSHHSMQLVEHGGGIQNYQASFDMLPEAGAAVVILTNRPAPPGVLQRIIDTIFEQVAGLPAAQARPTEIRPDRTRWQRYAGTYVNRFFGLATVAESGGILSPTYRGETVPLKALRQDLYYASDAGGDATHSVGFPPNPEYLMVNGNDLSRFEADPCFVVDTEILRSYEGTYFAKNGDHEVARLIVSGGQLLATFQWHPQEAVLCTPLNSHSSFATAQGCFTLETETDGTPVLVMNGWRSPRRATNTKGASR